MDEQKKEAALAESKRLREQAYAAVDKGSATPSKLAIADAYPGLRTGFLSKLFNKSANALLEIAFDARDRAEYDTTGTTAALKIARDRDLQEADRFHLGVQRSRPKMTP